MKIPDHIIPDAYDISKKVYEGELTLTKGKKFLAKTINENSAGDYINNFRYLMDGQVFQRTLNAPSMDYYLSNIYKDYGGQKLSNALSALRQHIDYYEGIQKTKTTMHSMRSIYEKYNAQSYSKSLITNIDHLLQNIDTVENYLTEGNDDERNLTAALIKRGICFVAYKIENEMRFAPSRFLGYIDNKLDKHLASTEKDGNDTNRAINSIFKTRPKISKALEDKYFEYCNKLGINRSNNLRSPRKFWTLELSQEFRNNIELTGEFPEGKIVERTHKARERNSQVVQIAKDNFKNKHRRLFCEVCKFDFEKTYGQDGKDFIEGHHTIAVSDMAPNHKTKPEDIAMLCANCHRMVHKKRPWLTMDNLQQLLKRQ